MIIPVALVVVIAAVAAVLLLGSGTDEQQTYENKLSAAFAPVRDAHLALSEELNRIQGTRANDARAEVRRAQQVTTAASGAVGSLSAPEQSEQLAEDAHQVLDRETACNSAVAGVLSNRSRAGAAQLQTLASNLNSALSEAGPTVAGSNPTVFGADRLAVWAPRTARVLHARNRSQRPASTNAGATTASSPPTSSGTALSGGRTFHVGQGNVSCQVSTDGAICSVASAGRTFVLPESGAARVESGTALSRASGGYVGYGSTVRAGSVTCRVPAEGEASGIACTNSSTGHGFEASRGASRQKAF